MILLAVIPIIVFIYVAAMESSSQEINVDELEGFMLEWFEQEVYTYENMLLLPLDVVETLFQSSVHLSEDEHNITIIGVDHVIEFKLDSREVVFNNNTYTMTYPPLVMNDTIYLSDAALFKLLEIPIHSEETTQSIEDRLGNLYDVIRSNDYVWNKVNDTAFWLNKQDGTLYGSFDNNPVEIVGTTDIELIEITEMTIHPFDNDHRNMLLTITDLYGEPHLHFDIHKILLHEGEIARTSSIAYWGMKSTESIDFVSDHMVMLDEHMMYIVAKNGDIIQTYNLIELTGVEDIFTVEWIHDDYLLVKSGKEGVLYLIYLLTNEVKLLYKEIVSIEQQEIIDHYIQNNVHASEFRGDELHFKEEKEGRLYFTFDPYFENEEMMLEYELDPTE